MLEVSDPVVLTRMLMPQFANVAGKCILVYGGLFRLAHGVRMLLSEQSLFLVSDFFWGLLLLLLVGVSCVEFWTFDAEGITGSSRLFFWSNERQNLLRWEQIHRLYLDIKSDAPLCDYLVVRAPDGQLREVRHDFSECRGDWGKAVEIIRRNLPEYAIGSAEEYNPGKLI